MAMLRELVAGSRPQEIARARAAAAAAQAETERLSGDYERVKALHARDLISRQEFERAGASYEVADQGRKEARENLHLVEEGPRREQIEQARARGLQAKEAVELARTRLSYATIASPLAGVVLSKSAEPGDYVAPGTPVVTVGALKDSWLRAYIEETDLGRVKVGQAVEVTADTTREEAAPGAFFISRRRIYAENVQTRKKRVNWSIASRSSLPGHGTETRMPADSHPRRKRGSHGRHTN
jgi:HlyD family secretion protein